MLWIEGLLIVMDVEAMFPILSISPKESNNPMTGQLAAISSVKGPSLSRRIEEWWLVVVGVIELF